MRFTLSQRLRVAATGLVVTLMTALSGCGTYGGEQVFVVGPEHVKPGDARGARFTIKGKFSYDQVWKAAMTAMGNGMTIIESHKPSGVIKSRVGVAPGGKVVGFFISPTTPNAERYQIDTMSIKPIGFMSTNGRGWDPVVVENFNAALAAK
jgi:hypothetical protein